MSGPFKMRGNPMQRNFGIGSPLHQEKKEKTVKHIKGTSIFGQTPKDFAIDAIKNISGYNVAKRIGDAASSFYDRISGSKTKVPKEGMNRDLTNVVEKGDEHKGKLQKLGTINTFKDSKSTHKKFAKKRNTLEKKIRMKPPYKEPTGPRAE